MTKLEELKVSLDLAEDAAYRAEQVYLFEDSSQEFEDEYYATSDAVDDAYEAWLEAFNQEGEY